MAYPQELNKMDSLHQDRKHFARLLGNIVADPSLDIIYCDESSFNSFAYQRKSWSFKYHPQKHPISKRYFSVTAYGAIGTCLTEPTYMLADSTNIIDFVQFLHLLRANLRPGITKKPFLLFDMHAAHLNAES